MWQKKLQDANHKQQVEKWDTDSDSDETDDEDLDRAVGALLERAARCSRGRVGGAGRCGRVVWYTGGSVEGV